MGGSLTVYMTKVWGFDDPCGPLQFSASGWRDKARDVLRPGDLVVLVGTMGTETPKTERGLLLGIMEPTTEVVSSLDFPIRIEAQDYDESGKYRWPFGLLIKRAWKITERKPLGEISTRTFNMDAALGIIPLTAEEAVKVMRLARTEAKLLSPARPRLGNEGDDYARKSGAPPPTTTRVGTMHMRRAPAFTYVMFIEGADRPASKIGWAFNYRHRQRQFNLASLPAIGGLRYRTTRFEKWNTAMEAFLMEQSVLRRLDPHRHTTNREVVYNVDDGELEVAWRGAFYEILNRRNLAKR
jgi:hypothetical protein